MSEQPSKDYRSLILAAGILILVCWPLLYLLLNTTLPTVGPRWFFFFLWTMAVTGTALPFIWVLHRRFDSNRPAPPHVLIRQSLWFGLYITLCLWLQINRSFSIPLALLIAIGFSILEFLIRIFERSTWRPD